MNDLASERLIKRAQPFKSCNIGISAEDIGKIPITEDFLFDIVKCLSSDAFSELIWGLTFAIGILDSNPPQSFLNQVIARLPSCMDHTNLNVRESVLELLVRLRSNFPNYRSIMLERLKDPNECIRLMALKAYPTFLTKKDIPLLLHFESDDSLTETSMNSPLIYDIRNQALEIIETLIAKKFPKSEKVNIVNGHTVYWWDWTPFLEWWKGHQKKWSLWK